MIVSIIKHIAIFIGLILSQKFVFDHFELSRFINVQFFIYYLFLLPFTTGMGGRISLAFLMGFILDGLNNSPGVYTFSFTLTSIIFSFYIKTLPLEKYRRAGNINININTVGIYDMFIHVFIISGVFHLLWYIVSIFQFKIGSILLSTISSTIFCTVIILIFELIFNRRK